MVDSDYTGDSGSFSLIKMIIYSVYIYIFLGIVYSLSDRVQKYFKVENSEISDDYVSV
jgi:hypothetical protein